MTSDPRPALDRPLALAEDDAAWYVVAADDDEDWLVRFEKDDVFPGAAWAANMVATFNARLERHRGRE